MRLLLLRHAKSSWDAPSVKDKDRPLNARGRGAAPEMGDRMADAGYIPDLILCSTAQRARETLAGVLPRLLPLMRNEAEVRLRDNLYGITDGDYLGLIAGQGGTAETLMLVGHNPAIERTARTLAASGAEGLMERLAEKYPTAALAVLDFTFSDWGDIAPETGYLSAYLRPRDLGD